MGLNKLLAASWLLWVCCAPTPGLDESYGRATQDGDVIPQSIGSVVIEPGQSVYRLEKYCTDRNNWTGSCDGELYERLELNRVVESSRPEWADPEAPLERPRAVMGCDWEAGIIALDRGEFVELPGYSADSPSAVACSDAFDRRSDALPAIAEGEVRDDAEDTAIYAFRREGSQIILRPIAGLPDARVGIIGALGDRLQISEYLHYVDRDTIDILPGYKGLPYHLASDVGESLAEECSDWYHGWLRQEETAFRPECVCFSGEPEDAGDREACSYSSGGQVIAGWRAVAEDVTTEEAEADEKLLLSPGIAVAAVSELALGAGGLGSGLELAGLAASLMPVLVIPAVGVALLYLAASVTVPIIASDPALARTAVGEEVGSATMNRLLRKAGPCLSRIKIVEVVWYSMGTKIQHYLDLGVTQMVPIFVCREGSYTHWGPKYVIYNNTKPLLLLIADVSKAENIRPDTGIRVHFTNGGVTDAQVSQLGTQSHPIVLGPSSAGGAQGFTNLSVSGSPSGDIGTFHGDPYWYPREF